MNGLQIDLFTNPDRFGDLGQWRSDAVALHAKGPIHRIEVEGFDPFWAVIGRDELMSVERRHVEFTNMPTSILASRQRMEEQAAAGIEMRTLINMDAPDHPKYRKLTAEWFKPASVGRMSGRLDELSEQAVAKLRDLGGEADFYRDVARIYPLQVILAILGLPEKDYEFIFKLTQEMFGSEDPELGRDPGNSGATLDMVNDFIRYFSELIADRQANPTDDLATLIATAELEGQPLPFTDMIGYYVIIATAGHDTTAAAMSGGMRALAEHPDQLQLLKDSPDMIPNAVEEIIRWSTPVRHFTRTSHGRNLIGDQVVADGDRVYLSYLAANLDPRVFEEPLRFDVTRKNADEHVAFGYGVHFCLGAQLARMELRSLLSHLIPHLESLELAGEPSTYRTTFVGGHKSVPIRYRLA